MSVNKILPTLLSISGKKNPGRSHRYSSAIATGSVQMLKDFEKSFLRCRNKTIRNVADFRY